MSFNEILIAIASLTVVGVAISAGVELLKAKLEKLTVTQKQIWVLGLSVVGGLAIYFLGYVPLAWWTTILAVLGTVNTAYLFIIKRFQ